MNRQLKAFKLEWEIRRDDRDPRNENVLTCCMSSHNCGFNNILHQFLNTEPCSTANGTARLWFENNEDKFRTSSDFGKLFEETFLRPEDLKSFTEGLLRTRSQCPGETYESYVQDEFSLCRRVTKSMTEDQKVSHLMKGVDEDLYQVLINREVCTVDQFVTCCLEVDGMSKRRIIKPRYERLPNVTHISTANEEDMSDLICRTVEKKSRKSYRELQRVQMTDQTA
ncbi:hypothetical protein AVEN_62825-1 [Araneus ventricosus]|uniref:Retrotransposon gag domain-containing protein n=1 Tax=Araneus ventricosus TaxID=182803 RepID=A0A4Y2S4B9_ARAVE|nr:hypothetical protein AVEN_62825-1 [Araneus ventricosus]